MDFNENDLVLVHGLLVEDIIPKCNTYIHSKWALEG
jgi:hypothetical protein